MFETVVWRVVTFSARLDTVVRRAATCVAWLDTLVWVVACVAPIDVIYTWRPVVKLWYLWHDRTNPTSLDPLVSPGSIPWSEWQTFVLPGWKPWSEGLRLGLGGQWMLLWIPSWFSRKKSAIKNGTSGGAKRMIITCGYESWMLLWIPSWFSRKKSAIKNGTSGGAKRMIITCGYESLLHLRHDTYLPLQTGFEW